MPRQTLPRKLASVRSSVLHARFYMTCADESIGDPAGPNEMSRDDYLRIAGEYRLIAEELLEEAVMMLRDSTDGQLAAWLAHPDHRVRQFAIEWMSVRGD